MKTEWLLQNIKELKSYENLHVNYSIFTTKDRHKKLEENILSKLIANRLGKTDQNYELELSDM
jgi:hypothetical protein